MITSFCPSSFSSSSSSLRRRATTARRTPSRASAVAMPRPMPMLAPVTSAVFPRMPSSMEGAQSYRITARSLRAGTPLASQIHLITSWRFRYETEDAIALAVAAAFAVPFAAQTSATATGSSWPRRRENPTDAKDSNPRRRRRRGSGPRLPGPPSDRRTAGSSGARRLRGAAAGRGAPVTSGTNAADRAPNTPKAAASPRSTRTTTATSRATRRRTQTWTGRFSELDKDNDGRLSQSEFDAMQAGGTGGHRHDRRPGAPARRTRAARRGRPQAEQPQAVSSLAYRRPRERAPFYGETDETAARSS